MRAQLRLGSNTSTKVFVIPAKFVRPLTLHWGRLPPFALSPADRASDKPYVYLDPGPPAGRRPVDDEPDRLPDSPADPGAVADQQEVLAFLLATAMVIGVGVVSLDIGFGG